MRHASGPVVTGSAKGRPRLANGRYAPVVVPSAQLTPETEALMAHLGHLAADAPAERDALVAAGALVPLALQAAPEWPATAVPPLLSAVAALLRGLHGDPAIRPLVRLLPELVQVIGCAPGGEVSEGSSPDAVEQLAEQARRVLADPAACVAGYRKAVAADRRFHAAPGTPS